MANVVLGELVKVYGDHIAVKGIDLTIEDGSFVALVGPSGCGKSTTLRMIAGLESISHGQIQIGGRIVNDIPSRDRGIAMVFQSYALYPHMTVFDNIAFSLRVAKVPRPEIDRRVRHASSTLQLDDYLDRLTSTLSGGQRQRVAMGRAIVREPDVFLFDEPLSNLDARLRAQMRMEIKRLHQSLGATSIFVTHDQVEAMTMADCIVVMRDGNIDQVGPPLEVFHRPKNSFVAQFIGSPAMNVVPGAIIMDAGGNRVIRVGEVFDIPVPEYARSLLQEGGTVDVGFRAEDIMPEYRDQIPDDVIQFSAKLLFTEELGNETLLISQLGSIEITSRITDSRSFRLGNSIEYMLRPDKVHLFHSDTGISLTNPE